MRCTGFMNQQRGEQRTAIGKTVDEDVWPEATMQARVNWIPRPEWLNPGHAARPVDAPSRVARWAPPPPVRAEDMEPAEAPPPVLTIEEMRARCEAATCAVAAVRYGVITIEEMRALCERGIVPDSLA